MIKRLYLYSFQISRKYVCEEIYDGMTATVTQAKLAEEETRKQSSSKIWFDQRSGCVTASKIYSVLHTIKSKQSVSLFCYPGTTKIHSRHVNKDVSTRIKQQSSSSLNLHYHIKQMC